MNHHLLNALRTPLRKPLSTRAPALSLAPLALAAALSTAPAAPAHAADTITVTATRVPTRADEVLADLTVLDRAALDAATGRTLAELLAGQAGIQTAGNGGLGKTASLFIRGLEARHTVLLVDGVRVGSATVGTPSLDNLPLSAIDRIEIVRGPLAALYGSGAVGGVIQVFTREAADGLRGNAALTLGNHDFATASAGVSVGSGGLALAAQVQHTDDRGASATNPQVPFGLYNADRDGFRQTAGSVRLAWRPNTDWRFAAMALESTGQTGYDDGPGADAQAALVNRVVSADVQGRLAPGWDTRVQIGQSTDQYVTLSSASAFASYGAVQSTLRQASWENRVATPLGTALLLLDRQEGVVARPGAAFDVSDRLVQGVALGLSGAAAGHRWQGTVRRDRNSQFGGQTSGSLAYGYRFTRTLDAGASLGQSFVAPSFNQLYYPGFGNPKLEPEQGRHGELNLRWQPAEGQQLKAAAYRNRYRGYITSGAAPVNLPYATIDGVTLGWEGQYGNLATSASWDHLDARNTTNASANNGKALQRRAKDVLRLGADWQAGAWRAGATLLASGARFDDAANTVRLGGYARLDLRAEWAFARGTALQLKVNNVADQRYQTALGYDQPGRAVFVTLRHEVR